ncbi:HdaA/DnaA family protein [Novosphingobium lentum]|uniref:HdaA/DnaA family protein n=1 Tax=Novosphingobium lentum TaxID=145287 RepID=UPI000837933D|nr:ATPase [Novosphingobium lentum]
MSQIALPLSAGSPVAETIVVGPSLQPVLDGLASAATWPFRTAVLAGPARSGKSLIARWFTASGLGEAIDDAHLIDEAELFHRWNRAQADGTPLLLVSGQAPGAWRIALPDLASRLGSALLLEIGAPDDELLGGLLEAHAARRGVTLGDGALAYLIPRIERSHAGIEALVATIDRLSLERKAPVTISLLRDALAERGGEWQPRLL